MYLMHENQRIAYIDNDLNIKEVYNQKLMPLKCHIGGNLQHWVETRLIDEHRPTSRRLKKVLRLQTQEESRSFNILDNNLLTITDNWWVVKDEDVSSTDYANLKKYNQDIAEVIIQGINSKEVNINLHTDYCELGTTGSYEKCWKYLNGEWVLFKENNPSETLSEVYSSVFLKECGFNVVDYRITEIVTSNGLTHTYTICKDFTNNASVDFEPLCNLLGDEEDISYIVKELERLNNTPILYQYLDIILSDILVYNTDRHNQNMGVLRNSITGDIISLAPNYDLNQTLIAYSTPKVNYMVKSFIQDVKGLPLGYREYLKYKLLEINARLTDILLVTDNIIRSIDKFQSVKTSAIKEYIIAVVDYLKELF